MARLQAIRGTNDFIYDEAERLHTLERVCREKAHTYGFEEVRTPSFEYTELFSRSIGEETDIVSKEMYTFEDRGGRSMTLRPEGTASVVRALIEHSLYAKRTINKIFYMGAMYRAERPQKGRYRQFHQFGVECVGTHSPLADVEVILLNLDIFRAFDLTNIALHINTVGCGKCKGAYADALREAFKNDRDALCDACTTRYDKNVLRMLDCKVPTCQEILAKAPAIYDHVCDECREHFDRVTDELTKAGVAYEVNPRLVRGLDYYTKTAFEIQDASLGSQNAICGGGRYDELIGGFANGKDIPAVGSAVGIERLLLSLEGKLTATYAPDAFVVAFKDTVAHLMPTLTAIRAKGVSAQADFNVPSVKSQFKSADRVGARYVIVLGPDEVAEGTCTIRDMQVGSEKKVALADVHTAFSTNEA